MNQIIWNGSGWYALHPKGKQWQKIRQDRIGDLRSDNIPVDFLTEPPLEWEVITSHNETLETGKDFNPGDEVMIIYAGTHVKGQIVEHSTVAEAWEVAVPHKSGRPHEETIHESFLFKLGNPERINDGD
jgi:hypothetical protein